jgi:acetoin utilization deacetylase AcuC-like enzyme
LTTPHVETSRRADCFFGIAKDIAKPENVVLSEREATVEELESIHDKDMVRYINEAYESFKKFQGDNPDVNPTETEVVPCVVGVGGIAQKCRFKPRTAHLQSGLYCFDYSTPIGQHTATQARKSAALAIDGAKQILDGKELVFSICRPPGHHATFNSYGGYCYFNNVALAAEALKGRGLVVILDIDYHHGNGTQDIFYLRNDVLFISIHADPDFEYPFYSGGADEIGEGDGKGFNINYPLGAGTDYVTYKPVIEEVVEKIKAIGAKTLLISFGADTAKGDPICTFRLVPEDYFDMGVKLRTLNIPTLVIQEGGYADNSILAPIGEALLKGLM